MGIEELKSEIATELSYLELLISDILSVRSEILNDSPSKLHIASITLYITQFYNGVENILKRISKFKNIKLPVGPDSHIELFLMFSGENKDLPTILDDSVQKDFTGIRRFRHFAVHGYAFQLDWARIKNSVDKIDTVFENFKSNIDRFLRSLS